MVILCGGVGTGNLVQPLCPVVVRRTDPEGREGRGSVVPALELLRFGPAESSFSACPGSWEGGDLGQQVSWSRGLPI